MRESRNGLPVASCLCPVFFGAGCRPAMSISVPPSCHHRIYGLHAPVVKLACGILPPQACECLELHVYISRATVWKLREHTDSKEFRGQLATASSFGGLIVCLYIPYLDSSVASVFLTFISLVRCFQVFFFPPVRNLQRRGVYVKWWVSEVCLTHGTSETFL